MTKKNNEVSISIPDVPNKCINPSCPRFDKLVKEIELTIVVSFEDGHVKFKKEIWRCVECNRELFIMDSDHLKLLLSAQKEFKKKIRGENAKKTKVKKG